MDLETAIRTRRTHKRYGPDSIDRSTVLELLDLARFAPNHRMTQPWRFRILGAETRQRLEQAVGEKEAAKLRRAPTLVLATAALSGDAVTDGEDLHAVAAAVYAVLLGATARGLASYWRTPGAFADPAVREICGLGGAERVVSLIHLGPAVGEPPDKDRERAALEEVVTFLP